MGRSSNEWADIRREMKNERMANPRYLDEFFLKNVWGDKYEKMIEALSWNGSGSAPLDYWMTFPGHGYLLADTYQRPVVLFSKNMSTTYLPISHPPTPHSPICLILISDILHIISFSFKSELWPAPTVDPSWKHYVKEVALPWLEWIQPNLEKGVQVLYPVKRRSSRLNKIVFIE